MKGILKKFLYLLYCFLQKNSGFGERPSSIGSHRAHESYDDDDDVQF